jgi:hypothetical protein
MSWDFLKSSCRGCPGAIKVVIKEVIIAARGIIRAVIMAGDKITRRIPGSPVAG